MSLLPESLRQLARRRPRASWSCAWRTRRIVPKCRLTRRVISPCRGSIWNQSTILCVAQELAVSATRRGNAGCHIRW